MEEDSASKSFSVIRCSFILLGVLVLGHVASESMMVMDNKLVLVDKGIA